MMDLLKELEDPDKLAAFRAKLQRDIRGSEATVEAETPLLAALARAGFPVSSVWDLVNTGMPYPNAVPILIDHLQRPYPERVLEGIARALAVPEAKAYWPVLCSLFRTSPDKTTYGSKAALAAALSATVDDAHIDQLIALSFDRSHGATRILLLKGLARSRRPEAMVALERLRDDPELEREVRLLLRRSRRRH